MSEIVTPPADNATDAMHYLHSINTVLRTALAPGELLWLLSMPPILPMIGQNSNRAYRSRKKPIFKEWLKHHSISKAPSGAHINMSISDDLVELVYQQLPQRFENGSLPEYLADHRSRLYALSLVFDLFIWR